MTATGNVVIGFVSQAQVDVKNFDPNSVQWTVDVDEIAYSGREPVFRSTMSIWAHGITEIIH